MDQSPASQPTLTPVSNPHFHAPNKSQLSSLRNKIILIIAGLVLLIVLFGGAYMLITNPEEPDNTGENLSSVQKTTEYTQKDPPTQEQTPWQIYTSTQLPGTSFLPYSLHFPSTWKTNSSEQGIFRLIKDDYEITINQDVPHGYDCIFEGTPDGPERDLRNVIYTQFESDMGIWRRFQDSDAITEPGETMLDFCIKSAEDEGFVDFSNIGALSYSVPKETNEQALKEMDEIVKTIKEVH